MMWSDGGDCIQEQGGYCTEYEGEVWRVMMVENNVVEVEGVKRKKRKHDEGHCTVCEGEAEESNVSEPHTIEL